MTFEEIKQLSWYKTKDCFDSGFTLYFLDGFSGSTNPYNNNICIVVERKNNKNRYSLELSCDKYGETGMNSELKVKNIHEAKIKALNIIEESIRLGNEYYR